MEPLATIELRHARIELWPGHVRTVFPDGREVPAMPNEGEDILDTAIHEMLHSAFAEAHADEPSHCLRAVADGDGNRWTPERRYEEGICWSLTPKVKALIEAMSKAYE